MEQILATIREFLPVIVAAIPGIIALISQRMKEDAESETLATNIKKVESEAASAISEATVQIQDIYQSLMDDLKEQMGVCKVKLDEVLCEVDKIKVVNENLVLTNKTLSEKIEEQRLRIKDLEKKVTLLIEQVKSLGETPIVTLNNHKEK